VKRTDQAGVEASVWTGVPSAEPADSELPLLAGIVTSYYCKVGSWHYRYRGLNLFSPEYSAHCTRQAKLAQPGDKFV